jgi:PhnB protein
MRMNVYLNFRGQCEAAFNFYAECFAGQLGPIFRYASSPMAGTVPPDWQDKVMHGSVTVGGQVLMGADVLPGQYEEPKGFSLSVQLNDSADADRIFQRLEAEGHAVMPLEKTFWAERFGLVVDRFGIQWMINCESVDPVSTPAHE